MKLWTREFAGWLLMIVGLYVFYRCYVLLSGDIHYVIEGGSLTLIGIVLFRGGLHLLKVATAARICLETQQAVERSITASPGRDRPRGSGRAYPRQNPA
jgi:hypothetical protein